MTGPEHYIEAEELLLTAVAYEQDGAPLTAAARRAEAQVHATLATVAPAEPQPVPQPEPYLPVALSIRLRELHQNNRGDCGTCADETGGAMRWPCDTFTALDAAERQLSPVEDEPSIDEVMSASEQHELDQADEFALDAAADAEQNGGDPR